jgi:hypothetical protein
VGGVGWPAAEWGEALSGCSGVSKLSGQRGLKERCDETNLEKMQKKVRKQESGFKEIACYLFTVVLCIKHIEC